MPIVQLKKKSNGIESEIFLVFELALQRIIYGHAWQKVVGMHVMHIN